MNDMGLAVRFTEPTEFEAAFDAAMHDPAKVELLTSLLAYHTGAGKTERVMIKMSREYTYQVLYRLGFVWPTITEAYFRSLINALEGLGYFDITAAGTNQEA